MLFTTSRPISWVNTAYPFAVGYLLAGQTFSATFFVGTLFFLIPYNLVLYGVNDVFDYESDMKNPRKGGVEGAITPKELHPLILKAGALLSLPFLCFLFLTGTVLSNVTLVLVMFFVLAYSMKGLRFKEIPVLDSITSSLHFVGPLIYALSLFSFPPRFWPYIVSFFLWGMASHAFGAVQDIIPDRQADIHSIATALGASVTVKLSLLFYVAASITIMLQGKASIVVGLVGLLYACNIFPYINVSTKQSGKTNVAWKRFLTINYFVGMVITIILLYQSLYA